VKWNECIVIGRAMLLDFSWKGSYCFFVLFGLITFEQYSFGHLFEMNMLFILGFFITS